MTLCDTCALACDERKGWEVLHKCGATGELRPYRVRKCSNYENYPIKKLGVVCPHCGSTNTYERTKEFGRVVLNGIKRKKTVVQLTQRGFCCTHRQSFRQRHVGEQPLRIRLHF